MFCCTHDESHFGELVTAYCLEEECIRQQIHFCCTRCLIETHQNHHTTTLKQIMPQLLTIHHENSKNNARMDKLLDFVVAQFGQNDQQGHPTTTQNLEQRVIELLTDMKRRLDFNTQEISKMRTIFKELNKSSQQSVFRPSSSLKQEDDLPSSVRKMALSSSPSRTLSNSPSQGPLQQSGKHSGPDRFSHSGKHAYINLGSNNQMAVKVSPSGHRLAVMSSKCLTPIENEVRLGIDRSNSGNIMVGFCHESVVRKKEFSNCYGIGNGTYLIGQNGNAPTAISFHHSMPMLNRKQVVGWNFAEGDTIILGVNFQQQYLYFQREGKQQSAEFVMKWLPVQQTAVLNAQLQQGFRLVVLLQGQGDQVSLLQM